MPEIIYQKSRKDIIYREPPESIIPAWATCRTIDENGDYTFWQKEPWPNEESKKWFKGYPWWFWTCGYNEADEQKRKDWKNSLIYIDGRGEAEINEDGNSKELNQPSLSSKTIDREETPPEIEITQEDEVEAELNRTSDNLLSEILNQINGLSDEKRELLKNLI